MKKTLYTLLTAALSVALLSCGNNTQDEVEKEVTFPNTELVEEIIDASPEGNTGEAAITYDILAEGKWAVEALDEYDWIEVTPTSGEGNATLTIEAQPNSTSRERSAEFVVKETLVGSDNVTTKDVTTYSLFVNQAKPESNLGDGSYAFLRQLVDGKMLGSATPVVDNWYKFDKVIDGITLENIDGKLEIVYINFRQNQHLIALPNEMNLPYLRELWLNEVPGLNGSKLPAVWDTPILEYCNIAASGFIGTFPTGIAASTKLMTLYANNNHFYGVYPHEWASDNLQCLICCNINNKNKDEEFPQVTEDNAGMGYLVPAQMDVILNKWADDNDHSQGHANESRDYTQMKLGGVFDGNYQGFEVGWGQHRYELYDPEAVIGDKYIWSMHRLLIDEQPASFFSNMGYINDCMLPIPCIMCEWDQAAADEWTKQAAAKYGK